jgi:tRNA(Ile)-lysidine synthase
MPPTLILIYFSLFPQCLSAKVKMFYFASMNILAKVKDYIQIHHLFSPQDRLVVAVSGGIDSMVLLHILNQLEYVFEIAHCNFQLRNTESKRDEDFVKQYAESKQVIHHIKVFDTNRYMHENNVNVQVAARQLRYTWFNTLLGKNEAGKAQYLLTAHHADDSIETMLHNLMQGTGIAGLHGIQPKKDRVVRPLLCLTRQEIEAYAATHQVVYVEDSSNAKTEYRRNFIRHTLLPTMKQQYSAVQANLLRTIQQVNEAELLYQQQLITIKKKLLKQVGKEQHLAIRALIKHAAYKTILWDIVKDFGFTPNQLTDIVQLIQADNSKFVASATHQVIKHRLHLIIAAKQEESNNIFLIDENTKKVQFELGNLFIEERSEATLFDDHNIACIDRSKLSYPLILRRWKEGDYFYPLGMSKKKKLARFFIDAKLSSTEKQQQWVLESNNRIVWLIGMRIDNRFKLNTQKLNIPTTLFTLKRN